MKPSKPSYLNSDPESYPWKPGIDYRQQLELYCVGKGEQGVLICEPYKSEICRLWRFMTPAIAEISGKKIFALFEEYLKANDLWARTWHGNTCKWLTPAPGATPITKAAKK